MWIIGHRGAAGTTPENTLASIADALNCGVDWIEIDVRMIDDTIIVLHDETLDRTTEVGQWIGKQTDEGWALTLMDFEVGQKPTGYPQGYLYLCVGPKK